MSRNLARNNASFHRLSAAVFLLLFISSCGDDNGDRRPFVTNLTVGVPITDSVPNQGVRRYSAPTLPEGIYKISVTGRTDVAVLTYFGSDSTFSTPVACDLIDNTNIADTTSEDCIITAPGNVIYFSVDGISLATSAASYRISVESLTTTNLVSGIPSSDSTTQTGARLYAFATVAGTSYTAAITGLNDDAELYIFNATCTPTFDNTLFVDTVPEDCTFTSPGGTVFFIVDGVFSINPAVSFTIVVSPAPVVPAPSNEGSPAAPIVIPPAVPIVSQAASGGTSFYVASGLTPGRYTVSLLGLTNDADLDVFGSDSTFSVDPATTCQIDNTFFEGKTPESCVVTISGNSLFYTVTGISTSGGVAYLSLVTAGP